MKRPDPATFAQYSSILAYVSFGLFILSMILTRASNPAVADLSFTFIWLVLPSSAAGAFMGWAARSDFKKKPGSDEDMQKAATGFRVNLLALILMIMIGSCMLAVGSFDWIEITPDIETTPDAEGVEESFNIILRMFMG